MKAVGSAVEQGADFVLVPIKGGAPEIKKGDWRLTEVADTSRAAGRRSVTKLTALDPGVGRGLRTGLLIALARTSRSTYRPGRPVRMPEVRLTFDPSMVPRSRHSGRRHARTWTLDA